jgi:hypothetical protein
MWVEDGFQLEVVGGYVEKLLLIARRRRRLLGYPFIELLVLHARGDIPERLLGSRARRILLLY